MRRGIWVQSNPWNFILCFVGCSLLGLELSQAACALLFPPAPCLNLKMAVAPSCHGQAAKGCAVPRELLPKIVVWEASRELAEGRDVGQTLSSWEGTCLGCCLGCVWQPVLGKGCALASAGVDVCECKGARRVGEGPVLFLPPLLCVYSLWKGQEGNSLMAAPAPYLAPLTALPVPLLMSTFSGLRTQGTCGGGDMQPAVLLWAVGPLVAVWSWGDLLGRLSHCIPSCNGKLSSMAAWEGLYCAGALFCRAVSPF